MHAMRTALLGAVSAGLGLAGCGERTSARTAPEAAADPIVPVVVPVAPVASASAAPVVSAMPVTSVTTAPDAAAPRADAGAKLAAPCASPIRYCLAVGDDPPDGTKGRVDPTPSSPKRTTCLPASAIYSPCNGMRAFSGPSRQGDKCCYDVCSEPVPCGRPFVVDGAPRVAPSTSRGDWRGELADGPERLARPDLADAWIADALTEHASVASFGRVALELLALGAPPELVAATHRAALDEIEHARTCFAIAARLDPTRASAGPGPLALGGLALETTPAAFAARLVAEGCVGETLASLVLREAAARCADPAIATAVRRMAEDEAEHAALAFRTAAWLVASHGEPVREAIRREASRARDIGFRAEDLGPEAAALGARLDAETVASVVAAGLREVVVPCLEALA